MAREMKETPPSFLGLLLPPFWNKPFQLVSEGTRRNREPAPCSTLRSGFSKSDNTSFGLAEITNAYQVHATRRLCECRKKGLVGKKRDATLRPTRKAQLFTALQGTKYTIACSWQLTKLSKNKKHFGTAVRNLC